MELDTYVFKHDNRQVTFVLISQTDNKHLYTFETEHQNEIEDSGWLIVAIKRDQTGQEYYFVQEAESKEIYLYDGENVYTDIIECLGWAVPDICYAIGTPLSWKDLVEGER